MKTRGWSQDMADENVPVGFGVPTSDTIPTRNANDARVVTVGFRFCIEFEAAAPDEGPLRILLDPALAKQLGQCLSRRLHRYEHFIGPIALPAREVPPSDPVEVHCSRIPTARLP